MDQLISFHKPNKNSEERENDGLTHFSNQTLYNSVFGLTVWLVHHSVALARGFQRFLAE
jgi:hypothetical protein